ncbi:hypothetical protein KP509_04G102100 [Ceratopteris richardii]|uniref:Uncharacterized protein n=1 Tax=Ceratopteris richardii TaxID=49495 RepID=A0A8T2V2B2_CERRI|nr:hypothetical protein KP509_04G102100 [Ceratopteris richardii]
MPRLCSSKPPNTIFIHMRKREHDIKLFLTILCYTGKIHATECSPAVSTFSASSSSSSSCPSNNLERTETFRNNVPAWCILHQGSIMPPFCFSKPSFCVNILRFFFFFSMPNQ